MRRLVGYRRFEGMAATTVLVDLYAAARLLRDIRAAPQRLVAVADATGTSAVSAAPAPRPLEAFLSSLRDPMAERRRSTDSFG